MLKANSGNNLPAQYLLRNLQTKRERGEARIQNFLTNTINDLLKLAKMTAHVVK